MVCKLVTALAHYYLPLPTITAHRYRPCPPLPPLPNHSVADPNTFQIFSRSLPPLTPTLPTSVLPVSRRHRSILCGVFWRCPLHIEICETNSDVSTSANSKRSSPRPPFISSAPRSTASASKDATWTSFSAFLAFTASRRRTRYGGRRSGRGGGTIYEYLPILIASYFMTVLRCGVDKEYRYRLLLKPFS